MNSLFTTIKNVLSLGELFVFFSDKIERNCMEYNDIFTIIYDFFIYATICPLWDSPRLSFMQLVIEKLLPISACKHLIEKFSCFEKQKIVETSINPKAYDVEVAAALDTPRGTVMGRNLQN